MPRKSVMPKILRGLTTYQFSDNRTVLLTWFPDIAKSMDYLFVLANKSQVKCVQKWPICTQVCFVKAIPCLVRLHFPRKLCTLRNCSAMACSLVYEDMHGIYIYIYCACLIVYQ